MGKRIIYGFLLAASISAAYGQRDNVASGGVATGAGGSSSYSIGQIDYITSTGAGGKASQGVQQPYEIFVISGIQESNINLLVTAFPNPASESILLKISEVQIEKLSYQIHDVQGKILEDKNITENSTAISMAELSPAIYFIKVLNQNKEIKSFKIIKN